MLSISNRYIWKKEYLKKHTFITYEESGENEASFWLEVSALKKTFFLNPELLHPDRPPLVRPP
jgi:hypothetical protein